MKMRHLEYFLEVSRYKSFSKAAEVTHISQPTISKAIKDLELELGATLFYRNTKCVELTDVGEAILEQVQQIFASLQDIHVQLAGLEELQTGKIHIGYPPLTAVTKFSHMLSAFKNSFPKIQIQLYELGPKKIEASLRDGLLDIGIFTPEDGDLFQWIWFEQDTHNVIMHSAHNLVWNNKVSYQNLDGEQLIIYNSDYKLHDAIIEGCKQAGFNPEIAFETSQREFMMQMVSAKLGLGILPSKLCQNLGPEIVYRPFSDLCLCLKLALTWRKDRYLSLAARQFLAFMNSNYLFPG